MATHADTTELLDTTITSLSDGLYSPAVKESANLIQQWVEVLSESENTHDMADKLKRLDEAVGSQTPDVNTIQSLLKDLAEELQIFSADTGSEGEMPLQLQSLATALRHAGDQLSTAE